MYKYLSAIFWIIQAFNTHFQVGRYMYFQLQFPDLDEAVDWLEPTLLLLHL